MNFVVEIAVTSGGVLGTVRLAVDPPSNPRASDPLDTAFAPAESGIAYRAAAFESVNHRSPHMAGISGADGLRGTWGRQIRVRTPSSPDNQDRRLVDGYD
jgi:hypothetical protein